MLYFPVNNVFRSEVNILALDPGKRYDFLIKVLHEYVTNLLKEENKLKWKLNFIRVLTIVLSLLVTVLLGLKMGWMANVALVASALLTAVNTWDGYANYKDLWIKHIETRRKTMQLIGELMLHLTEEANHADMESYKEFYTKFQELNDLHLQEAMVIYQKAEKNQK